MERSSYTTVNGSVERLADPTGTSLRTVLRCVVVGAFLTGLIGAAVMLALGTTMALAGRVAVLAAVLGSIIGIHVGFQLVWIRQLPGVKAKRIVRQLGGTFRSRGWLWSKQIAIDLRASGVTDDDLHELVKDLAKLPTLRRIDLPAERISTRTLDELRFVVPECEIRTDEH